MARKCEGSGEGYGQRSESLHPNWLGDRFEQKSTIDGELFAFAGLWDRWKDPSGQWVKTCSILTTPNAVTSAVHDRMPVILNRDDYELWLDPGMKDVAVVSQILRPFDARADAGIRGQQSSQSRRERVREASEDGSLNAEIAVLLIVGSTLQPETRGSLLKIPASSDRGEEYDLAMNMPIDVPEEKRKRGNPEWGKPLGPVPVVVTEFEAEVARLGLTRSEYSASPELKRWCTDHRNRVYVPEWLLEEWGMKAEPNTTDVA